MHRYTKVALLACAALFVLLWTGALLSQAWRSRQEDAPAADNQATPLSVSPPSAEGVGSVVTAKGRFTLPGAAFADGRDTEARPPLTVMKISVWNTVPRTQRVCDVTHGDQLEVSDAKRSEAEDRYYFKIKARLCEGWLPETFVSPKKERIVGDRH